MQAKDIMSHHIPGAEGWMEVTTDIYDIARRVREGDESGWRGDPTASVMFNPVTNHFEVWMIDETNTPYIACSNQRCDHTLIMKLIEGDWQKGRRLLEEIQKKNRTAHAAKLSEDRDRAEEIADKMHWAIIRDLGHLEGGTRRQYSFNEKGK